MVWQVHSTAHCERFSDGGPRRTVLCEPQPAQPSLPGCRRRSICTDQGKTALELLELHWSVEQVAEAANALPHNVTTGCAMHRLRRRERQCGRGVNEFPTRRLHSGIV